MIDAEGLAREIKVATGDDHALTVSGSGKALDQARRGRGFLKTVCGVRLRPDAGGTKCGKQNKADTIFDVHEEVVYEGDKRVELKTVKSPGVVEAEFASRGGGWQGGSAGAESQ